MWKTEIGWNDDEGKKFVMIKKVAVWAFVLFSVSCGGDDTDTGGVTTSTTGGATGGADAALPKACETNVTGRITVQNTGTQIITVVLNAIDHGPVNTGASIDVDLPPGPYTLEIKHLDGGVACTPSTINISECSSQHVSCAG